jgi:hypothetical protein
MARQAAPDKTNIRNESVFGACSTPIRPGIGEWTWPNRTCNIFSRDAFVARNGISVNTLVHSSAVFPVAVLLALTNPSVEPGYA